MKGGKVNTYLSVEMRSCKWKLSKPFAIVKSLCIMILLTENLFSLEGSSFEELKCILPFKCSKSCRYSQAGFLINGRNGKSKYYSKCSETIINEPYKQPKTKYELLKLTVCIFFTSFSRLFHIFLHILLLKGWYWKSCIKIINFGTGY